VEKGIQRTALEKCSSKLKNSQTKVLSKRMKLRNVRVRKENQEERK
jgi:hypothetical protein